MLSYSLNSVFVFYEVVKLNSFSKAADLLLMTQPGVSSHVAQLEAQTGARLLIRKKGKWKLTKEGEVVFGYAKKIETMARGLETAINLIREQSQTGFQASGSRGRPKPLSADKRKLAVRLYDEKKHSIREICQLMGISKPTLYKYIRTERKPES